MIWKDEVWQNFMVIGYHDKYLLCIAPATSDQPSQVIAPAVLSYWPLQNSCSLFPLMSYMFWFSRLNLKGNREVCASGFCLDDECWRLYEQKVLSILSQGLSDRAKFIRVIWRNFQSDCDIENVSFNIPCHLYSCFGSCGQLLQIPHPTGMIKTEL